MRHDFPLIRYPGSKAKKSRLLANLLPEHDEYREPFAGSAALLARIEPHKRRWINDVSPQVAAFHSFVRDHPSAVQKINRLIRRSRDDAKYRRRRFNTAVRRFKNGIIDPLGFLLMSRYSYSGIVVRNRPDVASYQDYDAKYGFRAIKAQRVQFWRATMQGVQVTCGDYEKVLSAPGRNVAIFLDPPYILDDHASPIYDFAWGEDEHVRLADVLARCPHRFVMTIHRSALTLDLYSRPPFRLMRSSYSYTIAHQTLNKRSQELIVVNY